MLIHDKKTRLHQPAFTLMELLAVMIVLSILMVVAAPSLLNNTLSSRLTSAGDLVLNRLSEAQQQAIAENSEVEVRFVEAVSRGSLDAGARLRSLQVFTLGTDDGAEGGAHFIPVGPRTRLEDGVVVSGKTKLSSLLDAGFKQEAKGTTKGDRYLSVRFLPDGSTELAPGSPWFLTLVLEDTETNGGVPANFYTVQIDPATGRVRRFRP